MMQGGASYEEGVKYGEEDERRPLVAKKRRRSWSLRLVVASVVVVAAMCIIPAVTIGWVRLAASSKNSGGSSSRAEFCVAHAAYGWEYKEIARVSAVSKRRYAELHGYRFVEYLSDSMDDFVEAHCPELRGQIELAYSKTTPVKSCGIWAALRDSCDYVLWTDADAVVVDKSLSLRELFFLEPSAGVDADDVARLADRDVLFFLEAYAKLGLCPELSSPRRLPAGFCGSADSFGNCVNTGALVLKASDFTRTLLRDQLALAVFDNDFLRRSPCSTNGLGAGAALNITWDQCMFDGETEQCTLSCLYRNRPELLDRTACRISDDNTTHYLYGTLLDPPPEARDSFAKYAKANLVALPNVSDPMQLFDGHHKPPHAYAGSLVYNCMGGDFYKKLQCVTYATYFMWPEMADDHTPPPDSLLDAAPPPSSSSSVRARSS